MRLVASVFLATVLLMPQSVAAQVVDCHDDTVLLDTSTNFEWLDVSLTTNRSFDDAAKEFGAMGWQHATATEVGDFWRNYEIPDVPGSSTDNFLPVSNLMELVCPTRTWFGGNFSSTTGMVSDSGEKLDHVLKAELFKDTLGKVASTALSGELPKTLVAPQVGHWLVRKPAMTMDPATLTKGLMVDVGALSLPKGMTNSLMAKLQAAMKNIADGNDRNNGGAVGPLSAFINEVNAKSGKRTTKGEAGKVMEDQSGKLIADAQAIIDALTN